jgi:hypothetical protein
LLFFLTAIHQMEDIMLLYVFWASLCLGLMRISAEAPWQAQIASRPKPPIGTTRVPENAVGID